MNYFVRDFDIGPDGDIWTPSGPATLQQKRLAMRQRREAINLVRTFIEATASKVDPDLYGKAKAFLFDVEHS